MKNDRSNANRFWELWGIRLFGGGLNEVLKIIGSWIDTVLGKKRWIATVNPEFVMKTQKDREFFEMLTKTDLNIIDGVGLVWARETLASSRGSRSGGRTWRSPVGLLRPTLRRPRNDVFRRLWMGIKIGVEVMGGKYEDQVVPGADLMRELCIMAARRKWRVFFLGGWGDRAARTAKYFQDVIASGAKQSPTKGGQARDRHSAKADRDDGVDWCPGEPEVSNTVVTEKINQFKPHLLFVAYGMRKQEEWIEKNLSKIDVRLAMGVGRSFDYYSGDLPRAPVWVRRMGMEWLYSLVKEPKRWRRQVELIRFVRKVVVE